MDLRTTTVAGVAVAALLLAGCSGGDDDPSGGGGDDTPSATASVDPDAVSPSDLVAVPEVRRPRGALSDVEFGECSAEPGEQVVTGTVTNPTGTRRDYAITVSWTNDSSDVLARGVAVVEGLAGGASEQFELSAVVPDAATTCTYYVQRGTVV